jgi:hypothetical protein
MDSTERIFMFIKMMFMRMENNKHCQEIPKSWARKMQNGKKIEMKRRGDIFCTKG